MERKIRNTLVRLSLTALATVLVAMLVVPALSEAATPTTMGLVSVSATGLVSVSSSAPGTTVQLEQWGNIPKNVAVGTKVHWTEVGQMQTSNDGSATGRLSATMDSGKPANITAEIWSPTGYAFWSFPYRAGQDVSFNIPRLHPFTETHVRNPGECLTPVVVANLGSRSVKVGTTYVPTDGVHQGFVYNYSVASTLGVGVSYTSPVGGYSDGGTNTQSNSWKINFGVLAGHQFVEYYTYFTYDTLSICGGLEYQTQSTGFGGGNTYAYPSAYPGYQLSNCEPVTVPASAENQGGVTYSISAGTAYNFLGGVNVFAPIGIYLSSQTGYTVNGATWYDYFWSGLICGVGNVPGKSTLIIAVGLESPDASPKS